MNKGLWAAVFAYLLWGFFPIYWKFLLHVPSFEILCHRMTGAMIFIWMVVIVYRKWTWIPEFLKNPKAILTFFITSLFIGINWFLYIWAVNAGFIVETALGYFINPLLSVLLGVVFLRESLRPIQWMAISIAAMGVLFLTFNYGSFPWIALTLAFSFGMYGYLRKTAKFGATEGMTVETTLLFFPALAYLLHLEWTGTASFLHSDWQTTLLLALSGVITAVPLLLFSVSARRITLTNLGLLQYIAPTLQFLIGVFLYREPFPVEKLIGFSIIWAALVVYTTENLITAQKIRNLAPQPIKKQ